MFLSTYPYQSVFSFEWHLGSQGGQCISEPVLTPLVVLYAESLEFLLQPLRLSPVGCQTLLSQCKITFYLEDHKIGVS